MFIAVYVVRRLTARYPVQNEVRPFRPLAKPLDPRNVAFYF